MKISGLWTFALLVGMCTTLAVSPSPSPLPADKPAFVFRRAAYWHRWSQNDQHEFTPRGQEDLQKWSDMVTINLYPDARDGDALAMTANAVLENYKNHQAMILKTDSVPRTPDRPAEHYIAVVFGQPTFIEAAFARFKLVEGGAGCSIVYSHRIYGEKVGDQMSTWLKANGPAIEKALMSWSDVPVPAPANRRAALPPGRRPLWAGGCPPSSVFGFPNSSFILHNFLSPIIMKTPPQQSASKTSPRITHVSWGRMEVDGVGSGRDYKLYPGGGREWDWKETDTHHVPGIQPADVEELLDHGSTVIVLSRGMHVALATAPETCELLQERGVPYHIKETNAAVELYNRLAAAGEHVGGLFHSTC